MNISTNIDYSLHVVKLCLKHGAKLNDRDLNSMTPVHYAAMNGFINILALYYHQGASLDVRDLRGRTPLMFASQGNHVSVLFLLLLLNLGNRVVIEESVSSS